MDSIWMLLPETTRGDALEAIDERGDCHLRWILHEEMHMVIFPIALHQDCLKVLTDLDKDSV